MSIELIFMMLHTITHNTVGRADMKKFYNYDFTNKHKIRMS